MFVAQSTIGAIRRFLMATLIAGAVVFAFAGMSFAATGTYPGAPATGTVSDGTVDAGGDVTFSGTGFHPRETILITLAIQAPGLKANGTFVEPALYAASAAEITTTADTAGSFSLSVHLARAGLTTLTATGKTSGHVVTASVTVRSSAVSGESGGKGGTGGGLARTGPKYDIATASWLAVGAIGLGGGMILLTASKRRNKHADRISA